MPVYALPERELIFPHPSLAIRSGLLAVGGDLSPERLLLAYQNGIFPWYEVDEPIQWYSPMPRLLLDPREFRLYKSLKSVIRKSGFEIRFDDDFCAVILKCKSIERQGQSGSWIHGDIVNAYSLLHEMGIAHSVEVYDNGKMIGGLYGLAIGKMFCGESMFAAANNASKIALFALCQELICRNYSFIDCQQDTEHLKFMGAKLFDQNYFFNLLEENKKYQIQAEKWCKKIALADIPKNGNVNV